MTDGRRRAERYGRHAESLAAWLLRLKGYRILARGYRSRVGELDIVARRGRVLAFVEVKARGDVSEAAEALRPAQRSRIARAAEAFQASRPELRALLVRFDVVLVAPGRRPHHLPDAWRPGL